MEIKKGKLFVILLFLIDITISTGLIYYMSYTYKTEINYYVYRIVFDLLIISLALTGVRWMKSLYMMILIFTGVKNIFIAIGILISESFKLYGLVLLSAGVYFIIMFFLFVYSKSINDFFDDRQQKYKARYNNQELKVEE